MYLWASSEAQIVNNLPATKETQVQSLGWEDPLEKEMATHFSIPAYTPVTYIILYISYSSI